MTLLHLLRDFYEKFSDRMRAATIRRLEQDLRWANASHEAHVSELQRRIDRLLAEHYRNTTSEQVTRTVLQRARGY